MKISRPHAAAVKAEMVLLRRTRVNLGHEAIPAVVDNRPMPNSKWVFVMVVLTANSFATEADMMTDSSRRALILIDLILLVGSVVLVLCERHCCGCVR